MKVLHIASGDLWAGAEKQVYTLLCALQQRPGTGVLAAVLNPGTLAERIAAAGIEVLQLDENRQSLQELAAELDCFIRSTNPDLIHTHRTKENILGGLLAWRHGIPSVRTQHGASEHPGKRFDLRKRALRSTDFIIGRYLQKAIVAVSDPLGATLAREYPPGKVRVIYNGLATATSLAPPPPTPTAPLRVGIVGRLVPVKRVDLFLDTVKIAAQCRDLPPTDYIVIGDGPLRGELEARSRELGIADKVHFSGHVSNAEPVIAGLDVLVLCSDHEGLPMVALEAMRHRTVILTHPIGGLPVLLDHGNCGVMVDEHTAQAFAVALQKILLDPIKRDGITERAYQRLCTVYSASGMAEHYASLYLELVRTAKTSQLAAPR